MAPETAATFPTQFSCLAFRWQQIPWKQQLRRLLADCLGPWARIPFSLSFLGRGWWGEEGETTKKSKENFDKPSNPVLNALVYL